MIIAAVAAIVIVVIIIVVFMTMGSSLPEGISEGDVLHCPSTSGVFRIENGQRRWYPNPAIYAKYGRPQYRDADCTVIDSIPAGPDFA